VKPGGKPRLFGTVQNRAQSKVSLVSFDTATGAATTLLEETSDVWVNLHNMLVPLSGGNGRFLWGSERSGFMHLYLYEPSGQVVRAVTAGEYVVEGCGTSCVDEATDTVYFTGNHGDCKERHLFQCRLGKGDAAPAPGGPPAPPPAAPRRVTQDPGTHQLVVNVAAGVFVDTFSNVDRPASSALRKLSDGSLVRHLYVEGGVVAATATAAAATTIAPTTSGCYHYYAHYEWLLPLLRP